MQKLQKEIHKRVGEIDEAAQNAQNTASAFETLKEKTSEVEEMLAGIQDVSVKTGILAINASIEAARAGKVGSGFRIIANEVRTLATQTGDFTKKIEALATEWKAIAMLARTHGQPASPTRLGKELKVFAVRLREQIASFSTPFQV